MADIQNNADAPARDTAGSRLAAKRAAKAAQKAAARGTTQPAEDVARSMLWATSWLDKHARTVWAGFGALALVGIGWVVVSMHGAKLDREAGGLLHAAVTTASGIVVSEEEPSPSGEEPLVPTFGTAAERDKKALEAYQAVDKKFPSVAAAHWAKLGEANEELALGKFDQAVPSFTAALAQAGDDTFLRFRTLEGLGFALENSGKSDQALKRFEELGRLDNGAYKTVADYQRARILASTGKRDEARKVLEALTKASADKPAAENDKFPSVTESAQTLLQELGGQRSDKQPQLDLSALGAGGGNNPALTQQIMDALRKQLAAKKSGAAPGGNPEK